MPYCEFDFQLPRTWNFCFYYNKGSSTDKLQINLSCMDFIPGFLLSQENIKMHSLIQLSLMNSECYTYLKTFSFWANNLRNFTNSAECCANKHDFSIQAQPTVDRQAQVVAYVPNCIITISFALAVNHTYISSCLVSRNRYQWNNARMILVPS